MDTLDFREVSVKLFVQRLTIYVLVGNWSHSIEDTTKVFVADLSLEREALCFDSGKNVL